MALVKQGFTVPMTTHATSRRAFLLASMGLAAARITRPQAAQTLTAGHALERIKASVCIPWRAQTVDNIVAGAADTPVKGIATTMMATLDVVQRAAASGKNMVITHEATFLSHQDRTEELRQDPSSQFELDVLNKNN